MLKTLNLLPPISVVALMSIGIVATNAAPRSNALLMPVVVNPCTHAYEGTEDRVLDNGRYFVSRTEPGVVGWRSRYGIVQWPVDSVVATADSAVCSHLDSLIAAWIASPAASTLGVSRDSSWPGISAVRINPHRYLVSPPLLLEEQWVWYFVVDSVSGGVQHYSTKW
jgi:hypothetical protein